MAETVAWTDYMEGYLDAMRKVRRADGDQKKLNVVGYCIAGTTLALTLALMKKRGDESRELCNLLHRADRLLGSGRVRGLPSGRLRRTGSRPRRSSGTG